MVTLDAHTTMSMQALSSERVRDGLKDILLRPARLYEAWRTKGARPEQDSSRSSATEQTPRQTATVRDSD